MTIEIHQENQPSDATMVRSAPTAALLRVADLMPRSLTELRDLSTIAFKSGLAKVDSPEQAAVLIMTGLELGMTPMQALRGIYSVEGRPYLASDTMVALIRQSGLCESWEVVETTDETCTIRARHVRAGEITRSFTAADAARAGLTKEKGGHAKYPRIMLLHRCTAVVARELFPEVILGMYVPEEQAEVVQAEVIRPRVVEAKEVAPVTRAPFQNPQPQASQQPARDWDAEIAAADTLDTLKAIGADLKETKATRSAEEGTRLGGLFQARKKALTPAATTDATDGAAK